MSRQTWDLEKMRMKNELTVDDQRIFICENLLGMKAARFDESVPSDKQNTLYALYYSGKFHHVENLPPLTIDWLWECAKALPKDKATEYHTHLYNDCGGMSNAIEASAIQRLAALVKTLGGMK